MVIALTEQQRELVASSTDQEPAEVIDSTTQKHYRLVSAEFYEQLMCEWRRDEAEQAEWYETSMLTLAQRLAEDK